MNTYANMTRLYCYGDICGPCLYDVVRGARTLTVNRQFSCGGQNGTWQDVPFKEVETRPAEIPLAVRQLTQGTRRTLTTDEALPLLLAATKQSIADSWRADAFHVVFASSGFDTRIIQACIWQLLQENGLDWLGAGLLFLSNRWEATQFAQVMQAQGWPEKYYAFYVEGQDADHFALGATDVWRSAPLPIPGNLWGYLPLWAEENGLLPAGGLVQAYTGLWANEAWNAFLNVSNPWIGYVNTWYGYNCMASLPVKAQWVEYPLVDTQVLEILARTEPGSGDLLRKSLATYAGGQKMAAVEQLSLDDRKHPVSDDLRQRLDQQYRATWLGAQWPWTCPTDSEFSTEWGKFSTAMMVEELRKVGVDVKF